MNQIQLNDPNEALHYFENKLKFTTGPAEVKTFLDKKFDFCLIDVRSPEDFLKGHIPGAINLPRDEWEVEGVVQENKLNIFYCYTVVCHLAARACKHFAQRGFSVMEMDGGFKAWRDYKYEVESEQQPIQSPKSDQGINISH